MSSTEMLARRRQWLLVLAALGFLLWQLCTLVLALARKAVPVPALLVASLAGFLVFIAALGGVFVWAKKARGHAALEDEMTRHNRLAAFVAGFWGMLIAATALFAAGQFIAFPGAEAARAVMMAGVVVPLLRFALLEGKG
ncbi:MAG: hypothetical protein JWO81_2727 [Alphaproteobacteria bacterium]|nr:hypothetical protein [Alphaproteobacteria bacterium]